MWPQVLPGGAGVLFTIYRAGLGFGDHPVAVLPLSGGQRQVLFREFTWARYADSGHLICFGKGAVAAVPFDVQRLKVTGRPVSVLDGVARGRYYAPLLGVSASGSLAFVPQDASASNARLVWVDRHGNVTPVPAAEQVLSFPNLSPDGRLLAVSIVNRLGSHIWLWDFERQAPSRLTFEGNNHAPVWSPGGEWIVYSSDDAGPEMNLYRRRSDGTGRPERLTSSVNHQDPASFSPDGKWLAYAEYGGETRWDLWVLDRDSQHASRAFLRTRFNEMEPMISPDGKWVAYSSDETGGFEVYVQPFPDGGRKVQVSRGPGTQPLWAPDQRHLYFRTPNGVTEASIETQPEFRVRNEKVLFSGYYRPRAGFGHPNYEISRNGQRFLMLQPVLPEGSGATEIHLVLNWAEEVRRLVR
jgi:dipeptidyl aminopeptidase/acylaminoacyl peptidase